MTQTIRTLFGPVALALAFSIMLIAEVQAAPPQASKNAAPEEAPQAGPAPTYGGPQKKVSIDQLKKQYWNQGGELDVVQNRIYSKANRVELDLFGGFIGTDPFLSVKALGGALGYYLSETFSVRGVFVKDFSSNSQAQDVILTDLGVTANTNIPSYFYGAEAGLSMIYGKLSLFGRSILYYDLHLYLGLGNTKTETGSNFTEEIGLGQQVFVSQNVSIRLDYRLMHYRETPLRKYTNDPVNFPVGSALASRSNFTNAIFVGVGFLF